MGVVALATTGAVASVTASAAERPWQPGACTGPLPVLMAAARGGDPASLRGGPWYRLDPVLDTEGALRGQRLTIGLVGDPRRRSMQLPAESFAAGPFGRVVLVGADDGVRSRLRAVDVGSDCAWSIADIADVIRRATMDPTGAVLYEMRVERSGRADLGIWRRPLDGRTETRLVLGPPPTDDRFGRTFATGFTWDLDGRRLAVQSCAEVACRTRLLTADGRPAGSINEPTLGGIIGLDGDRIVTYAACRGLPCPIVATDARSGRSRVLVADGGPAVVAATGDGARVVDDVVGIGGRHLRSTRLDGGDPVDLGPLPTDQRLHVAADRSGAAMRLPVGWLLLAPDGRLPADPSAPRPILRRLADGATVPFGETVR